MTSWAKECPQRAGDLRQVTAVVRLDQLHEGDRIEARIFFEGDERGGVFFLKGQDVHRRKG